MFVLRVVLEGLESETVCVVEVVLATREEKEKDRARDEHEADEDLEGQDRHNALLESSDATVVRTTLKDVTGMNTAQTSGDITPA